MKSNRLPQIFSRLEEIYLSDPSLAKKAGCAKLKQLKETGEAYKKLYIPDNHYSLYEALIKRGGALLDNLENGCSIEEAVKNLGAFIRYSRAASFDFRQDLKGLNRYSRSFIVTAVLFMALTPQFYGPVLPVIFVLPIYAGLRGIRRRSRTGLMLTLSVIPMALMTGITWIEYLALSVLPDYQQEIQASAASLDITEKSAGLLIIVPSALGVLLFAFAALSAFWGFKYREMFL